MTNIVNNLARQLLTDEERDDCECSGSELDKRRLKRDYNARLVLHEVSQDVKKVIRQIEETQKQFGILE